MKRNIIAVICIMLVASFLFVSCKKEEYKYYTDKLGETHYAYTNDNGETVTNIYGDVIIIPTDKNGEPKINQYGQAETEALPSGITISANGKKIDCPTYSLKLPGDWIVLDNFTDYAHIRLGDKDSDIQMDIQVIKGNTEKTLKYVKSMFSDFAKAAKEVKVNKEEPVEDLKDGTLFEATKFTFVGSVEKDDELRTAGMSCYVFYSGKAGYLISCTALNEDDFNNTDFEEVINAIEFK